ncbi:NAD kinase [uncultured archaeon]|nr:NAD kinase [uncultured archaeon]
MKIAITGSRDFSDIVSEVKRAGIEIDDDNPDFVITYGGDGSILWAESRYPSIPKITVRASDTAKKCMYDRKDIGKILEKLKAGDYKIIEEIKLEAAFAGNALCALNEFQLRSSSHVHALRFSVFIDKKPAFTEVISDGVVIATPFGSSAYYSSVGGKKFKKGVGIALNNPHDFKGPRSIVADESSEISVKILREGGILMFDNNEKVYELDAKDAVKMRKAQRRAKFVALA